MNHAGGMEVLGGNGAGPLGLAAPSDPVELRRLNFQTPGMMSHPPIPVHDLAAHIDDLKANDNMKFSQEYESIEPGTTKLDKRYNKIRQEVQQNYTRGTTKLDWFQIGLVHFFGGIR